VSRLPWTLTTRHFHAAPRQLEHGHPAEAVAHRRDPAIDLRLSCQNVDTRALAKGGVITAQLLNPRHHPVTIAGNPVPAQVASDPPRERSETGGICF